MLYKLGGSIKNSLLKFRDFYTNNKKQIYSSLFMLSLYPHYSKFSFKNGENSNKIDNFLTLEDANERKNCLSNISYKILFDFSNQEKNENENLFSVKGKVIILFDFDVRNFPQNKQFLKLDYQGNIVSIYLDDQQLKVNKDYYVNNKETKENFVVQEKNCVFINKNIIKETANKLTIEFLSEYTQEFRSKEINNPFLFMEPLVNQIHQKSSKDFVFSSNDPYNLNKLFPCFDQPNLICDFEFFYLEKIKDIKALKNKDNSSNKRDTKELLANNTIFYEVTLKIEKEEILNNFLFEKQNLKIFKSNQRITANTNKITLIKRNLNFVEKYFDLKSIINNNNETKKYLVMIFYEEIFEREIKSLINYKIEEILSFYKLVYEWFSNYFGFNPQRSQLTVSILKELNKQIISNQGMIILDVSCLNPHYDILEKNYMNFLFIHQVISNIIHDCFNISWWNDSFIIEGLIVYLANLFISDSAKKLNDSEETKYMKYTFINLKNRAYKLDMSPDSHRIDMPIENTEEAFNFFDEILVYKTAAVFDYFNSINPLKFKELLKKFINENTGLFSSAKPFFDRQIFNESLHSIQLKNKDNEDLLELKLAKVFDVLTGNKGVIKIETKLERLANKNTSQILDLITNNNIMHYKLELTQHPLFLEKNHKKSSSLYLMEITELTLVFKSGKTVRMNIIILPKLKNIYNLTSQADDEIIGVFINTNDKNYLRQIFEDNFIKNLNQSLKANSNFNYLQTIFKAFEANDLAKLVFMRDLFFCLSNNEIKELSSDLFFDFCVYVLETEKNTFLKNEILKKFVFTIINFCQYYTDNKKEDYVFYKTIKHDSEMVYKRKAFDVLFRLVFTEPNLKKNIINNLIDLLSHFYNVTTIDQNLVQKDDVKMFIELLQRETFPQKQYLEKFSPIDFYENVSYLDEITKKRSLYTIMILYSNQSKYFLTARINLKKEIGMFPPELDRVYKDSITINEWKERKNFWKNVKKLNEEKMNQENFEKLYYIAKYIRINQIKESKEIKEDKFFKIFLDVIKSSTEFYSILFYKYLNPSYIITQKNLDDFKKMRNKIKNDISKYLLYLIDYDIYFLVKNFSIYNHNKLHAEEENKEINIKS